MVAPVVCCFAGYYLAGLYRTYCPWWQSGCGLDALWGYLCCRPKYATPVDEDNYSDPASTI